jgi:hypothetical protein
VHKDPEERLVPADSAQIRQWIGAPRAVGEVLEVPGTDDRQRLEAAEVLAAGLGDVEAGQRVPQRSREVQVDPAMAFTTLWKPSKLIDT